jgi:hypothetical protein
MEKRGEPGTFHADIITPVRRSKDIFKRRILMDLKTFNEMVRPCMVRGHKAVFHRWIEHSYVEPPGIMVGSSNGGQVSYLTALIEFETGQVEEVRPKDVIFRDFAVNRLFGEYIYGDDEHYEEFLKMLHDNARKAEDVLTLKDESQE